MPDREVRPATQYDWVQIIRRARLGTVIAGSGRIGKNGRPTRGGMSGSKFTGLALAFASYASPDGSHVWPGDATIAVDLETTIKDVAAVRKALLALGLLEHVRHRRGDTGEQYRLTLPSDLDDVLEVLNPAQHKLAAHRLREEARGKPGKPGGSGGPPKPPTPGGPQDHPEPVDNPDSGGPVDHPNEPEPETPGWSTGLAEVAAGWSTGPALGGPPDPLTNHDQTTTTTNHSDTALRTAVTLVGHPQAAQDPLFAEVVDEAPEPDPPPSRCERHPLPGGLRDDGQPRCALCRVEARRAAA